MRRTHRLPVLFRALPLLIVACGPQTQEPPDDETPIDDTPVAELGLGELDDQGVKADGWGAALNCKPIPDLPALADPEIIVSLDGLTLHLRDRAGTYDKVFPVGVGSIDSKGRSYTPSSTGLATGVFTTGRDTREVPDSGWGWYYPCRIWWTDTDTGGKKPVFAGLPFIRLEGPPSSAYAIHGPVDAFSRPDGGTLRRGYVSHGCVRMAAADIVEVYARIKGKARTPVRVQQEPERDPFGKLVDVPEKWIGQECTRDADCNYTGGKCALNGYGRGMCTQSCTRSCPDRAGYNTTRCISDGNGGGQCVVAADKVNNQCKGHYARIAKSTKLLGKTTSANVCVPGTPGQIGDPCLADGECGSRLCEDSGLSSGPGFCSQACSSTCPGNNTICTTIDGTKRCIETCWGQDACSVGLACEDGVPRAAGGTRRACIPGE